MYGNRIELMEPRTFWLFNLNHGMFLRTARVNSRDNGVSERLSAGKNMTRWYSKLEGADKVLCVWLIWHPILCRAICWTRCSMDLRCKSRLLEYSEGGPNDPRTTFNDLRKWLTAVKEDPVAQYSMPSVLRCFGFYLYFLATVVTIFVANIFWTSWNFMEIMLLHSRFHVGNLEVQVTNTGAFPVGLASLWCWIPRAYAGWHLRQSWSGVGLNAQNCYYCGMIQLLSYDMWWCLMMFWRVCEEQRPRKNSMPWTVCPIAELNPRTENNSESFWV